MYEVIEDIDMSDAPWWDDPKADVGNDGVVRHAPDADHYHLPDDEQIRHMPRMRGRSGRFAIIPAAKHDGSSRGFDHTVAGVVHVDPGAPDGGVIFDANEIDAGTIDAVVQKSKYPHQAFYALGRAARPGFADADAEAEFDSTPPNNQRGKIVTPSPTMLPIVPVESPVPVAPAAPVAPVALPHQQPHQQPQYVPQYAPQQYAVQPPQYSPYVVPPVDPNVLALVQVVSTMQQQIATMVKPPSAPATKRGRDKVAELSTQPVELGRGAAGAGAYGDEFDDTARPIHKRVVRKGGEVVDDGQDESEDAVPDSMLKPPLKEPARQTLRQLAAAGQEPDGVFVGFETLKLPFVNGPIAHKPKRKVIFEVPGLGRSNASYHAVVNAENILVLVYDTRYEEGSQYVPAEFGDKSPVILHVQATGKRDVYEKYKVYSMGLTFQLGVLDLVVLVKQSDEEVQLPVYGDDDEI